MQYSTDNQRINTTYFDDVYFQYSGVSQTLPNHSFGPAIRKDYLIHIILQGEGDYLVHNQHYTLRANQGFIIEPGVSTFYKSSSDRPWKYCWLALNGRLVKKMLTEAGLLKNGRLIFTLKSTKPFVDLIKKSFNHSTNTVSDELILNSIVLEFLSNLIQLSVALDIKKPRIMNPFTLEAQIYITKNYPKQITVNQISQDLGVDRSYLSRLFKRDTHLTVKQYLNHIRLTAASELLTSTDLPITEISLIVGFINIDVFIRNFKEKFTYTPLQYRKERIRRASIYKQTSDFSMLINRLPLTE
ncbi:AraC family transcriptional regulator [Globicatella sanguinis]